MHERTQRSYRWPGIPLALGSAILFGITPLASKLLLGTVSPFMLAGLLYLGAGLGLGLYRAIRHHVLNIRGESTFSRREMPWIFGAIGIGGVLGPVLLMLGLSMTTASSASLLLNLEGLLTMVIAWIVFRENLDRSLLVGALAILAGAVVLTWQGSGLDLDLGGLLVAGACLAWGIDNNLTRNVSETDAQTLVMLKGLVAGFVNVAIALALGEAWPGTATALAAGIVGFAAIGLSLVMFVRALRHLGAARTSAYFGLAPFIGALLSAAILFEPITIQFVIAAVLMGAGLWLHVREHHEHEHAHEALEHDHPHIHDMHHQHHHDGLVSEPHSHWHRHEPLRHSHPHYPDMHHQHSH